MWLTRCYKTNKMKTRNGIHKINKMSRIDKINKIEQDNVQ